MFRPHRRLTNLLDWPLSWGAIPSTPYRVVSNAQTAKRSPRAGASTCPTPHGRVICPISRFSGSCEYTHLRIARRQLAHCLDRNEAFFTFTPLADRLFHMPSFMSLLSLPTTHPKFPFPAILHGMCALGSMYAPDVAPSPGSEFVPSGITISILKTLVDSGYSYDGLGSVFAEIQIKAAKEAIDLSMRAGPDLFACLQGRHFEEADRHSIEISPSTNCHCDVVLVQR